MYDTFKGAVNTAFTKLNLREILDNVTYDKVLIVQAGPGFNKFKTKKLLCL
jgi:hypothetical protein